MSIFRTSQQFYECVGELMNRAKRDAQVGPKIAKSGLVIRFCYTDPSAMTTIDARHKPTTPGTYLNVINGACELTPDVVMTMKADVSHAFWHGKVNLLGALAKRDIVLEGPLPKILKLLPAVEPMYKLYPALLKEQGYANLVLK
jgi:hypothetical protein